MATVKPDRILVDKKPTPWAKAHDHDDVVLKGWALVNRLVPESYSKMARIKILAHAIFASGCRQGTYNFNVWRIKQGSGWGSGLYKKEVYQSGTTEEKDGEDIWVAGEVWRAYDSYEAGFADYSMLLGFDKYQKAFDALHDDDIDPGTFANMLKACGYWTSTREVKFTFNSISRRIVNTLKAHGAEAITTQEPEKWSSVKTSLAIGSIGALLILVGTYLKERGI